MYLILEIKDHNHGAWLWADKRGVQYQLSFSIVRGQDNSLQYLDKFLRKFNLRLSRVRGAALLVRDASLTQVKVFATLINVLAWYWRWSLSASFYEQKDRSRILQSLIKKLLSKKKFRALSIKYKQKPDITIKPQKHLYKIVK